ncbi:hypothetical protein DEAC_c40140 [Desulfosporosinus acididurans]|uniref:Uncharacterized protein n=1 Tax=Desulfosporosinus acididurans TaxID=476652 RepID=A0A0J1FKM7_9FIRM|nr:HK97 gp10 family phage protein [Desulfosporosinus acididurans]KLU64020.1 hypothetical protein DEAC_c40140 [Desulfosporosinus acididurans]
MADDFEITFVGIEDLKTRLDAVRSQYPYKEEEVLKKLGQALKTSAKDKTPVGKSMKHLKDQYKLSKVEYEKEGSFITMTNKSPLFHLVENGHEIKNKKGGPVLDPGFVEGKHMVETAMIELDQEMPAIVNTWLDNVLGDLK